LGLIRNYCYVLKNNDEQKEKAISVIEKAVDKSGRIIDNLLNFSRSTNHQWENITLEAHIHAILSLQRNRALKEGIDLEIKCPYGLQVFVLVESLDMILINLTSNAMDAITGTSQEEHGKIIIACSENDEKVVLKIRDNGEGIPEEIKEEIFNHFFTTKEKRDGNGLGLYIVYNEIQKMNGKIFVESQVAKGTEFTVEIPKWEGVNHGA
ncbi:MAG: HAMP domain-containing sensor histidine kinase, partial [Anaerovorax sp.]